MGFNSVFKGLNEP